MYKDTMRSKMELKFYCSKHPENELTFSTDFSKVGANSAYEVNVKMAIHPCSICLHQIEKIENAVDVLLSVKNGL
jgi:hypothetical protein